MEIFTDQGDFSPLSRIESVLMEDLGLLRHDDFFVSSTDQLAAGIKAGVQVVILPSNFGGTDGSQVAAEHVNAEAAQTNLRQFVENGGVLVMHMAYDFRVGASYNVPLLKPALTQATYPPPLLLVDTSHPLVLGPDLTAGTADDWTQANIQCQDPGRIGRCNGNARNLPDLPSNATVIITAAGEPVLAEFEVGLGKILLTSILVESGSAGDPKVVVGDGSPRRILTNELSYAILQGAVGDADPPTVSGISAQPNPAAVGTTIRLEATVEDQGCSGARIEAVQYSLDGGALQAMAASDGAFDESTEGAFVELAFAAAGVHDLCVTAVDAAGNASTPSCTLVAVYDPAAGFVTGAGTIESPLGAYVAAPNLKGLGRFAFVSRYRRGSTLPDGNTLFAFQAGDLEFRSSAYEWLVVAGARAQFKGQGTINGSGDFGFLLTAVDGDLDGGFAADGFRIKIWDRSAGDELVYDNKIGESDTGSTTTELLGGSIRIHP